MSPAATPVPTAVSSARRKTRTTPAGSTLPVYQEVAAASCAQGAHACSLVALVLQAHLAPEEAVDHDEVDHRQHHAYAPPDEAHRLAVVGGGGVRNGKAVLGVDGGEDPGVNGENGG